MPCQLYKRYSIEESSEILSDSVRIAVKTIAFASNLYKRAMYIKAWGILRNPYKLHEELIKTVVYVG